jgi:hypothetical protein
MGGHKPEKCKLCGKSEPEVKFHRSGKYFWTICSDCRSRLRREKRAAERNPAQRRQENMAAVPLAVEPKKTGQAVARCSKCGGPIYNAPEHLVSLGVPFTCKSCKPSKGVSEGEYRSAFDHIIHEGYWALHAGR